MKAEKIVGIEPTVLRWARESAGMSVEDVAARMKRQAREIEAWEDGTGVPTYSQLESLAYKHYKRPLAVFFLPAPPKEHKPRQEFRTLPEADMAALSRDTYLHIRKAHAYQVGLSEFYSGVNPAARRLWDTVSLSINENVAVKASEIRAALGVDFARQGDSGDGTTVLSGNGVWRLRPLESLSSKTRSSRRRFRAFAYMMKNFHSSTSTTVRRKRVRYLVYFMRWRIFFSKLTALASLTSPI